MPSSPSFTVHSSVVEASFRTTCVYGIMLSINIIEDHTGKDLLYDNSSSEQGNIISAGRGHSNQCVRLRHRHVASEGAIGDHY